MRVAKAAYAVDCRAAVVVATESPRGGHSAAVDTIMEDLFREGVWPEWRTVVEPELHPVTLRGRAFSSAELRTIKAIVETSPDDHRFALSKKVCRALGWYQPNGRLKDRACRDVLARLEATGLIQLPPPRRPAVRRRPIPITDATAPHATPAFRARDIVRSCLSIVTGSRDRKRERLWNEYVEHYHYLRYGVSLGPHIKYFVEHRGQPIACMAFGGAAWRVEARDRWIGWSDEERASNLHLVVNNTRFLIFPWVKVANLASRILALAAHRLPEDWFHRYAYRPALLETFVNTELHAGTCYTAANWTAVGQTKGRGRMDRKFKVDQPKKAVFLYPLVTDVSTRLRIH
jgi:Druantia protein DruA